MDFLQQGAKNVGTAFGGNILVMMAVKDCCDHFAASTAVQL